MNNTESIEWPLTKTKMLNRKIKHNDDWAEEGEVKTEYMP